MEEHMQKKSIKETNGITLISLVITIIILLILAGVTLSLTIGDNGIITQAQKAKEAQEIAAIKEDLQLAILDKELEKGGTGLTQEELEEIAGNYGELQEDGNTIKTEEGYEIKIDEIYQPGGTTGGSGASDEELAALQEQVEELQQQVNNLENTKIELEGTIEDLNEQLEQEQENNAALQEQIDSLEEQVANLISTKEQLEQTINNLNTQIANLQAKQATGNATVADVLSGKTFSNSTQSGLTGTMANRGTLNWAPSNSTSYSIPAGYYSGGTISTANAYNGGYNAGNSAGYNNGYSAGYNAGHATALNVKAYVVSVTNPSGVSNFTNEDGTVEAKQYVQASYSINGTILAVRIDAPPNWPVFSYWSREMDKTIVASSSKRNCGLFLGATVTNTGCVIPLNTSSGLSGQVFNVTIYYVS